MYHLFIGYLGPSDEENEISVSASRFLEYTDSETQMRYRDLNSELVRELKEYPALIMHEQYEDGAFVASIANIGRSGRDYRITFERNDDIGTISPDDIEKLAIELDIEDFEFYRTHWAVKKCDLLMVLSDNEIARTTVSVLPENEWEPEGSGLDIART